MSKDVVNSIEDKMNKYKRRMKRIGFCGAFWVIFGIIALASGIALLVNFAKYWGDDTTKKSGLAYTGLALVLISLLLLAVGIVLCAILCVIWKRLNRSGEPSHANFRAPAYEYGKAPYPQQPPMPAQNQAPPPQGQSDPSAPMMDGKVDHGDVNIEVEPSSKF